MPRQPFGLKLFILLIMLLISSPSLADDWHTLASGIEYRDIGASLGSPWSHVHAFRIDLNKNQFELAFARHFSRKSASIEDFAQHRNALIALNGGFFDRDYHPLGLRISQQKQYNPLKRISWWGIFYIKDGKAYVSSLREYQRNNDVEFAIQSGPRLIVDGKLPHLKPGVAERSALGITPEGQVIIVVTENAPLSTTSLAQLLKSPPLHCQDALNLDGGSSSQIKADIGSFQLNVMGFSNVSDAIVLRSKG